MGCRRPAEVRHIYAGADALAVDEAVLGRPRRPAIRAGRRSCAQAHHWFGLSAAAPRPVDGARPPLGTASCAARTPRGRCGRSARSPTRSTCTSATTASCSCPTMDTVAFPPLDRPVRSTRAVRWARQRAFGLRPPARPMADAPDRAQLRGVLGRVRAVTRPRGRSRSPTAGRWSASLFLASAVRLGLLAFLRDAARTSTTSSPDRRARAPIGCGLARRRRRAAASSARRGDRYAVRGPRARAIAAGDALLTAHYRSMLDYQTGPYEELARAAAARPGEGRDDLDDHADGDRRGVAGGGAVRHAVPDRGHRRAPPAPGARRRLRHRRVHARSLLEAPPGGPRSSASTSRRASSTLGPRDLRAAGSAERSTLHVGDVRTWDARTATATTSSR